MRRDSTAAMYSLFMLEILSLTRYQGELFAFALYARSFPESFVALVDTFVDLFACKQKY